MARPTQLRRSSPATAARSRSIANQTVATARRETPRFPICVASSRSSSTPTTPRGRAAAPPPRGVFGGTSADETWLARHSRNDLVKTGADQAWLARHGEERADPFGGAAGEADPAREPLRLVDQRMTLPDTQPHVDARAGRAAVVSAQMAFKHRKANRA